MALDPDLSVFGRIKTVADYNRENEAIQLKRQLLGNKDPAAIQIADELAKARATGDVQRMNDLLIAAKSYDKGLVMGPDGQVTQIQGYAPAIAGIDYARSGAKQQGEKDVDLNMNPQIKFGEANAANQSDLNFKPQITAANTAAEETAKTNVANATSDSKTLPIIDELSELNAQSIDSPYLGAVGGVARIASPFSDEASKASTTIDLMKQARLNAAAPLAKQLGVNPTDKDFQASLDRIFDLNSNKASRQAQIDALGNQIRKRQQATAPNPATVAPTTLQDMANATPGSLPPVPPYDGVAGIPAATPQPKNAAVAIELSQKLKAKGYSDQDIKEYLMQKGMVQ